jgi:hypothetical protein
MDTFVKVAKFRNLPDAQIALGRLEAEGIPAFLADEYLVQALPGAIGEIPLLVAAHNESHALEVLATDYSLDLEDDHEAT